MLEKPRQFRAIVFTGSFKNAEDAIAVFPPKNVSATFADVSASATGRILRGHYFSEVAYPSNEELLASIEVSHQGRRCYRYDVFLCEWPVGRSKVFAMLVPFTDMGSEVFGLLDEAAKPLNRSYRRLNLIKMAASLFKGENGTLRFSATSAQFLVDGGDSVTGLRLVGSNVLTSKYYRLTSASLDGLELEPRKLGLLYSEGRGALSFTADGNGNFWFRLGKDGGGVEIVPTILKMLEKSGIVEAMDDFPIA